MTDLEPNSSAAGASASSGAGAKPSVAATRRRTDGPASAKVPHVAPGASAVTSVGASEGVAAGVAATLAATVAASAARRATGLDSSGAATGGFRPRAAVERASAPRHDGPRAGRKPVHKGQQTRAAILDAALALASHMGLEGLSIGALAEVTQMSKSGVFAHFGSREELQISVIREYHLRFEEEVFFPAIREPRGLPRLRALFERWIRRVSVEIDSGCIYISGAVEFDDRPGPVRDALVSMVRAWQSALERAIRMAVEAGHLAADTDTAQMLFEIHGLILALHHDARFLRHPGSPDRARAGFERLITDHLPAAAAPPPRRSGR